MNKEEVLQIMRNAADDLIAVVAVLSASDAFDKKRAQEWAERIEELNKARDWLLTQNI